TSRLLGSPEACMTDSGGDPITISPLEVWDNLTKSHFVPGLIPKVERSKSSYATPQCCLLSVSWSPTGLPLSAHDVLAPFAIVIVEHVVASLSYFKIALH